MRMRFRITLDRSGKQIVEVYKNNALCAVIYPDDGVSDMKIVSAHFAGDLAAGEALPDGVKMDNGEGSIPPVPCVRLTFDCRPYTVTAGRIVRRRTN